MNEFVKSMEEIKVALNRLIQAQDNLLRVGRGFIAQVKRREQICETDNCFEPALHLNPKNDLYFCEYHHQQSLLKDQTK